MITFSRNNAAGRNGIVLQMIILLHFSDVSLDADVYKLPIHWIVPAELYEFQETSRDTAISSDNKQRYKNYVVLEHDYWKVKS